jgi:hypothetical protein
VQRPKSRISSIIQVDEVILHCHTEAIQASLEPLAKLDTSLYTQQDVPLIGSDVMNEV